MAKTAFIFHGGWDGHQPAQVAEIFRGILDKEGFQVRVDDSTEACNDRAYLESLDLIIPIWTMGSLDKEKTQNVSEAVAGGVGLAGCHGGMCDAFRENVLWQFITGGNWVAHPGGAGVTYPVQIRSSSNPLVEGMKDFEVTSEQYYLHVDPAVEVLATTPFPMVTWYHSANGHVDMPVVWTKRWGLGRIYYNALGHHADVFQQPTPLEMMRRGFLWAASGNDAATRSGESKSDYESADTHF